LSGTRRTDSFKFEVGDIVVINDSFLERNDKIKPGSYGIIIEVGDGMLMFDHHMFSPIDGAKFISKHADYKVRFFKENEVMYCDAVEITKVA
jgi:signal peptidase I